MSLDQSTHATSHHPQSLDAGVDVALIANGAVFNPPVGVRRESPRPRALVSQRVRQFASPSPNGCIAGSLAAIGASELSGFEIRDSGNAVRPATASIEVAAKNGARTKRTKRHATRNCGVQRAPQRLSLDANREGHARARGDRPRRGSGAAPIPPRNHGISDPRCHFAPNRVPSVPARRA